MTTLPPAELTAERRMTLIRGPGDDGNHLAEDARAGLLASRKTIPAKYFYDARGSELFEAICHTPEYYPTRTEAALLQAHAGEIVRISRPALMAELGSGSAEKTPHILEQIGKQLGRGVYAPIEISPSALQGSAKALLGRFPWLTVTGICTDYEHGLSLVPPAKRRLIAFLGSTLGNFTQPDAVRFVANIAAIMGADDHFLLGADLIKDEATLNAAYNDVQGYTAAFNLNVLNVMNRKLGAHFDVDKFEHLAFYNSDAAQIEMHLVSKQAQEIAVDDLGVILDFEAGETIRTEISRKFSRSSLTTLLQAAGLELSHFWTPTNDAFALCLARKSAQA